jgi:S1-C subfamily serine protease
MRPAETASAAGEPEATPTERPRRLRVMLTCAAAAVVAIAVALWWLGSTGPPPLTQADVDQAVQRGIEQARQEERSAPSDAATAYQAISPSLVSITTLRPGTAPGLSDIDIGSGVIVNADGAILTALHVVDGAEQIQLQLADGTMTTAQLIASQPEIDIAVLAAARPPEVIVPAVLAGPPPIGDPVFAVGNPLGLQYSLSAGVVSATDRAVPTAQGATLTELIQFDAAVNPGNSGGPLLNRAGQVVGIVTGLANPSGQDFFVGIGFAVPIATAGGAAGGPQQ